IKITDKLCVEKRVKNLWSASIHIERFLGNEIVEFATLLRKRVLVYTTIRCLPGNTLDGATAVLDIFGKRKLFFFARAHLFDDRDNIGNHIPRFLQNDRVSNAHIEASNLIFIMECRTRDHRTRYPYGT